MKTQTKLTLTLAAAAALMMTGCGGGSSDNADAGSESTVQYVPFDAPPIDEATKQAYLNAVNAARAQGRECYDYSGNIVYMPPAPPLEWSDGLYRAAYEHTEDMATVDTLQHAGSGTASDWTAQVLGLGRGSTIAERQMNNGAVPEPYYLNENVSWRTGSLNTLENVMSGLLSSKKGHCYTIMDPSYRYFGMAHVGTYWSQEFSAERK